MEATSSRPRIPRAAISRYTKKLAQLISGDVDLRFSLEVDDRKLDVWVIRLTPGFVQVILYVVVYEPSIRNEELARLRPLVEICPALYEVLSERAGAVAELRYFLYDNKCRFYVWARGEDWARLLLPVLKKLYQQLRQRPSSRPS